MTQGKPLWFLSARFDETKLNLYQNGSASHPRWVLKDINEIRRVNTETVLKELFGEGKSARREFAEALQVEPAFLGRVLNPDAAQPRNVGDVLARRIEELGGKPLNWLDQDHERSDPASAALGERFRGSPPEMQALILLALNDPNTPLPESIRPSVRALIDAVRLTVKQHIP